jgi:hypothetical protein
MKYELNETDIQKLKVLSPQFAKLGAHGAASMARLTSDMPGSYFGIRNALWYFMGYKQALADLPRSRKRLSDLADEALKVLDDREVEG